MNEELEFRQGEIARIESDSGLDKRGKPYKRWIFHMTDDMKYSTFNADWCAKFKPGDLVRISGKQKGQFFNATGMEKVEEIAEDAIVMHKLDTKCSQNGFKPEKDPVGLAVEVFNNLNCEWKDPDFSLINRMDAAIMAVKQAQEAFS